MSERARRWDNASARAARFSLRRPEAWIDRAKQWSHPKIIAPLVAVPLPPTPRCCPLSNFRQKEWKKRNRGPKVSTFIYTASVIFHISDAMQPLNRFSLAGENQSDQTQVHLSTKTMTFPNMKTKTNDEWMSISRIDLPQNQEELNKKSSIKKIKKAFFLHFHNFPSSVDLWIYIYIYIYIYI